MDYIFGVVIVERQDVVDVQFHLLSADQHEIKYEYQDEDVDGEAADAAHDGLPDTWKPGDEEGDYIFA